LKFFLCFLACFCVFSRQTGGLNHVIDQGSRAINYILTVIMFNVVPTILEVTINSCQWLSHIICCAFSFLCHLFLVLFCDITSSLCFSSHLQIGMVSSILAYNFGSSFALITSISIATYIAFTLAITQVWIATFMTSQDLIANINMQFIIYANAM
jgi:ATP-binding cassette, subfamily B (MDR/TAP), member 7